MSDFLTSEQSEMLKKVKENSIEYASLSDNEKEIFKFLKTYQYIKFTGKSNDIYSGSYTGKKRIQIKS